MMNERIKSEKFINLHTNMQLTFFLKSILKYRLYTQKILELLNHLSYQPVFNI
jgi:hypothetical protein